MDSVGSLSNKNEANGSGFAIYFLPFIRSKGLNRCMAIQVVKNATDKLEQKIKVSIDLESTHFGGGGSESKC